MRALGQIARRKARTASLSAARGIWRGGGAAAVRRQRRAPAEAPLTAVLLLRSASAGGAPAAAGGLRLKRPPNKPPPLCTRCRSASGTPGHKVRESRPRCKQARAQEANVHAPAVTRRCGSRSAARHCTAPAPARAGASRSNVSCGAHCRHASGVSLLQLAQLAMTHAVSARCCGCAPARCACRNRPTSSCRSGRTARRDTSAALDPTWRGR